MSTVNRTGGIPRALMAEIFVATRVLAVGTATAPAQAQYFPYQYNNPSYGSYPYDYGYLHYAWWRWHQCWRQYHQYYGR